MGGGRVNLYLTDPPYNVAYTGKTADALTIQNDKMDDESFRTFLHKAFKAADMVLLPGGVFYVWHADLEGFNFRGACRDVGWTVRECLIWSKNSMVLGRQDYQWKHEPCLYGWKEGAAHAWYSDRSQTTVLEFDKPVRNAAHPTMKPVDLFAYLIQNSSKEGDIVLDSFGGSGTTIIACEGLKRQACVMELDPAYCDVIIRRWQDATGQKAVREDGKTFDEIAV
jgi:site-specific DNA-methyltransferase (adenine-specific)